MPWEDLDSELAEMFGELATSAEKIEAAQYVHAQWKSAEAKAYLVDWRRRNRARCNAYLSAWRAANRGKANEYRAKWREKNRERLREYEREKSRVRRLDPEYLMIDRERKREHMRRVRAAKNALTVT